MFVFEYQLRLETRNLSLRRFECTLSKIEHQREMWVDIRVRASGSIGGGLVVGGTVIVDVVHGHVVVKTSRDGRRSWWANVDAIYDIFWRDLA
jgi:hypothetical protein